MGFGERVAVISFFGAFSRICLPSPSVSRLAPRVPQLQLQRCEGGGAFGCIQLDRKGARCRAKLFGTCYFKCSLAIYRLLKLHAQKGSFGWIRI